MVCGQRDLDKRVPGLAVRQLAPDTLLVCVCAGVGTLLEGGAGVGLGQGGEQVGLAEQQRVGGEAQHRHGHQHVTGAGSSYTGDMSPSMPLYIV